MGRTLPEFAPVKALATGVSIAAALKNAVAREDALWDSGMVESPSFSTQSVPESPCALPPVDLSHEEPAGRASTSSLPGPRRAVSIVPLSDLSDLSYSEFRDCALGGSSPGPAVAGPKRKRPLTEAGKKYRRERHRKQRATEAGKAKRREKKGEVKSSKPPTERVPHFPKDLDPQPISSGIKSLSHFPVVSTGYIGDKNVEPILKKHIWTLEMLVEMGLEVFEWDGR